MASLNVSGSTSLQTQASDAAKFLVLSFNPSPPSLPLLTSTFWLWSEEEAYDICCLSVRSHCITRKSWEQQVYHPGAWSCAPPRGDQTRLFMAGKGVQLKWRNVPRRWLGVIAKLCLVCVHRPKHCSCHRRYVACRMPCDYLLSFSSWLCCHRTFLTSGCVADGCSVSISQSRGQLLGTLTILPSFLFENKSVSREGCEVWLSLSSGSSTGKRTSHHVHAVPFAVTLRLEVLWKHLILW